MMLNHYKVNTLIIVWLNLMSCLIKMINKPRTDLVETIENTGSQTTTTTMLLLQIFIRHTLHAKYCTNIMSLNLHHNPYLCFHKVTQLISVRASHIVICAFPSFETPPSLLLGYMVSLIITKKLQDRCHANCKED